MFFLTWISSLVETAVLRGFAQAAAKLNLEADPNAPDALAALESLTALPEASGNGDLKPTRKQK